MSQKFNICISVKNKTFCLFDIQQQPRKTTMIMQLYSPKVHTSSFPQTRSLLEKFLPNIDSSICTNKEKIPFIKEVRDTEIGHLFEHIFLMYLYKLKLAQGYSNTSKGETSWNWKKYPKGTFQITVNSGYTNKKAFIIAFKKSTQLLMRIMNTQQADSDYGFNLHQNRDAFKRH